MQHESIISRTEAKAAGLTRYRTGRACIRGHVAERYVSTHQCQQCFRAWYVANAETIRAKARARTIAQPDERAAIAAISEARKRGAVVPEGLGYRDFLPIYAEARRLTRETGVRHEVDHIVAISRGGKHEPSNLQILTKVENCRKGAA